jgi:DNA-binding transcriptional ArsR family regulator
MKPLTIGDPNYVKAMSHPLRVRILGMLSERTSSPRQLADRLQASLGVVSYHVRSLERFGLVELVRETRVRGAVEHHYRARRRPHVTQKAWESASPIAKQAAVGSSLQLIGEYAQTSAGAGGFDRSDAILSRRSLCLDARGFAQLARLLARTLDQATRIEEKAAERIRDDPHAEGIVDVGMVTMLFEAVSLSGDDGQVPRSRRRRPVTELRSATV